VKPSREGPTVLVQVHGGLRSPYMTITPAGTKNNPYGQGHRVHKQCPHTSSMAMFRTFRRRTSQGKGLRVVCTVATLGPTS
jgi:hypothetical protein